MCSARTQPCMEGSKLWFMYVTTGMSLRFQVAAGKYDKYIVGRKSNSSRDFFWIHFFFYCIFLWKSPGARFIITRGNPQPPPFNDSPVKRNIDSWNQTSIEKAYLRFGFGYFPYRMQANDWIISHDQCRITACKHHTYSWVTNVAYFALNFTCDWPWFIQRMHDTEYCGNIPDVNNCSYIQALVIVISIPLIKLGSPIFLAGSTQ